MRVAPCSGHLPGAPPRRSAHARRRSRRAPVAAAQAQCERAPARGEAKPGGAGGGGSAMYRHGRAAAAAAAARLHPAAPLRAWASHGARGAAAAGEPRRRYRARPQDPVPPRAPALGRPPSPPAGLDVTTVDGEREDDIAVREPPGPPPLLLLRPAAPHGAAPPAAHTPPPSMEQHLALMHQKLQHELPNFLLKVPDYALYAHDVEFIHRPLRLHTRGRPQYQVALALCRALAWGYFASARLEVLALTRHREDWSIRARWRLTGLPLHQLLLRWHRRDKRQLLRSYDAFSTFFLNSQGLIRCHCVDKVMPAPTALPEPKKLLVAAAVTVVALAEPGVRLALKPPATSGDT
ncbi:uncharacterized protein C6orf136 homolog [Phaenicophaeus curvirostris]|uniref:uncharacterized protein C6orf136 homolog n=1 Tax=Phaenicophaeus curvirostris TaxID=33595 RepID=UPI0037F0F863